MDRGARRRGRRRRGGRRQEEPRRERPGPGVFDPPSQDAKPWYPLVLVLRGVTGDPGQYTELTLKSVHTAVLQTLGISLGSTTAVMEYRFHWAQVWMYPGAAGGPAYNNLGVVFYALNSANDSGSRVGQRAVREDIGTPVRPATVYHRWNEVDRQTIIDSDKDFYLLALDASAKNLPLVYQISLVWRSSSGDPVPSLRTGSLFRSGIPRQVFSQGTADSSVMETESTSSSSATSDWQLP